MVRVDLSLIQRRQYINPKLAKNNIYYPLEKPITNNSVVGLAKITDLTKGVVDKLSISDEISSEPATAQIPSPENQVTEKHIVGDRRTKDKLSLVDT
jgi:hypothetical protein